MVKRKFKLINAVFFQGTLSRADLEQCLRSFFPLKDDETIEALMKACEQEAPGESVQYKNLFTEVRKKTYRPVSFTFCGLVHSLCEFERLKHQSFLEPVLQCRYERYDMNVFQVMLTSTGSPSYLDR